jgi:hypothetical protein
MGCRMKPLFPTRDGFKSCSACLVEKPVEDFHFEPRVKSQTTAKCRACTTAKQAEWRRSNPERIKASRDKYAARFPDRVLEARRFTRRRLMLEGRERRIAEGKPLLEPRITENGRRCSSCRRRKDVAEFPPNAGEPSGVSCYCRECVNRKAREQREKPATKAYRRDYMRRLALKKYRLTPEQFDQMLGTQGGKCAICCDDLTIGTGGVSVDHDHKTGTVRGLLCRLCNVGIGHFREREENLNRAIEYLQRTR